MRVKEVMNPVIKIAADATVYDAARLMDAKNIGSLLIGANASLVGIVTERDILRKIVARDKDSKKTLVREIMNSQIITINSENSIEEANEIMTKNRIRRLPVESGGEIVGMVTIRDVSDCLRYSLGRKLINDNRHNTYKPILL